MNYNEYREMKAQEKPAPHVVSRWADEEDWPITFGMLARCKVEKVSTNIVTASQNKALIVVDEECHYHIPLMESEIAELRRLRKNRRDGAPCNEAELATILLREIGRRGDIVTWTRHIHEHTAWCDEMTLIREQNPESEPPRIPLPVSIKQMENAGWTLTEHWQSGAWRLKHDRLPRNCIITFLAETLQGAQETAGSLLNTVRWNPPPAF